MEPRPRASPRLRRRRFPPRPRDPTPRAFPPARRAPPPRPPRRRARGFEPHRRRPPSSRRRRRALRVVARRLTRGRRRDEREVPPRRPRPPPPPRQLPRRGEASKGERRSAVLRRGHPGQLLQRAGRVLGGSRLRTPRTLRRTLPLRRLFPRRLSHRAPQQRRRFVFLLRRVSRVRGGGRDGVDVGGGAGELVDVSRVRERVPRERSGSPGEGWRRMGAVLHPAQDRSGSSGRARARRSPAGAGRVGFAVRPRARSRRVGGSIRGF